MAAGPPVDPWRAPRGAALGPPLRASRRCPRHPKAPRLGGRSARDHISVKLASRTTEGFEIDDARPGILAWELELQPKEQREIEVEYTVRHPKDLVIPGL